MGLPLSIQNPSEEEELSDAALAIIEHVGEILAAEYVALLKASSKDDNSDSE